MNVNIFFEPDARERRSTVAWSVRIRSDQRSRAINRSAASFIAIGSAPGMAGTLGASTTEITGVTGPPRISIDSIAALTWRGGGGTGGAALARGTGWGSAMAAGPTAPRRQCNGGDAAVAHTT